MIFSPLLKDNIIHLRCIEQRQHTGYVRPDAILGHVLHQRGPRPMRDIYYPRRVGSHQTGQLGLLGTCRLLRQEFSRELFAARIFCFSDPISFERWMFGLSLDNRRDITYLSLTIEDIDDWNGSFGRRQIQDLTGLRHLRLKFVRSDFRKIDGLIHNQNAWK